MIEECQGIAVVMDRDCYGNTVSANVLAHNFGGGVDLRDAWGCAVSANTFTMDTPFGVRVGPQAGRITITGNNFSNAHIGGKVMRDDAAGGVLLEGASHVVISGNIFTGLKQQAVKADADCRRIAITGNGAADLNRGAEHSRPALDLGGAKQVVTGQNDLAD
jgi:parallel beta-helix repeat protein